MTFYKTKSDRQVFRYEMGNDKVVICKHFNTTLRS